MNALAFHDALGRDLSAAVREFGSFAAPARLLGLAPPGDGHSVLVLPGWCADDDSTRLLRWYLTVLGYRAHGWGLGPNRGLAGWSTARMTRRLDQLADKRGRTVSIVGWSLGGVLARALAHERPEAVRLIITLGSPLRDHPTKPGLLPVPCTSVYSSSDPIVPYRRSQIEPGPTCENVEVRGSHVGLGHNPAAMLVVADRLAQPEGLWRPFQPGPALASLYPAVTA